MLSYLSAETGFVRAFGNRVLLLIFLCALTRTGQNVPKGSAFGISVDLNPGIIAVYGPLLALLLLVGLKSESNILLVSREAVLAEASKLPARVRRVNRAIYALFCMPTIAAAFLVVQYYKNVVPDVANPCAFDRTKQFYDLDFVSGIGTVYCIHDLKEGMPWIYMPFQIYIYIAVLAFCVYLTMEIIKDWSKVRG